MQKSIEVQGRTEDEAIELALEQLGMSRDDVSVEIVEQARTGFLGLKNTPAIVKVFYEAQEERAAQVDDFLTGLFTRMDIEVNFDITESDDSISVLLTGKEPGALIGRRGETLDAIQHLTNYVVNRSVTGRVRVNLDAENYRQRRNEALESLASRTAGKAIKYRRNMTLDPMNAYERHVIHTALQEHKQVSTFSVGSEPNRRVVVAFGDGGGERTSERSYERSDRPARSGRSERSDSPRSSSSADDVSTVGSVDSERPDNETPQYREWS